MEPDGEGLKVVVVGAGVAGLNAASALVRHGAEVTVLERRPYVGGRAYSYLHPTLDEVVDSQHVLLGCCTNLLDFCDRAGLAEKIRWYDKQTFLEPGGRASTIELNGLPAPMHYSDSFLKASMLSLGDKLTIARGLMEFARGEAQRDDETVLNWYKRTRQTEGAVRHFWEPILLATLNDSAEHCSMKYAGKVFYELFLKTAAGGKLGIPTVPLSEFYGAGAEMVERDGGKIELRASVEQIEQQADGAWLLTVSDGRSFVADQVVLALPFEQTQKLIAGMRVQGAEGELVREELMGKTAKFVHSPFISILLWYDREITDLDHAWLLDTTIQWFFHKSRIRGYAPEGGSYVELVIAGSKKELPLGRAEILEPALQELAEFFPETRRAKLLKSGILKEARATFTTTPGLDAFRPEQQTGFQGLVLAGDWTKTDWPATMESAARSGMLAAEVVCRAMGNHVRLLKDELRAEGVMWLLAK